MAGFLKNLVKGPEINPENESKEMGFLDHIEELRWHLIRGILVVITIAGVALLFQDEIFEYIIYAPKKPEFITYRIMCAISESTCFSPPDMQLVTRELGEQFFMGMTVSLYLGAIIAFPYLFYEFWSFIKPGLYEKEVKVASRLIGITSMLFLIGVLFGYFIISPFAITYLGNYTVGTETINSPTLASYINYLTMFTLPVGFAFEMPVVVFFLAKIGIVGPNFMKKYRREAILIIFIIAGVITPPDVLSQILVGVPMILLYEVSIGVARRVEKNRNTKNSAQL